MRRIGSPVLVDFIKATWCIPCTQHAGYIMYQSSFESSIRKIELKAVLRFFQECSFASNPSPNIGLVFVNLFLVERQHMRILLESLVRYMVKLPTISPYNYHNGLNLNEKEIIEMWQSICY